MQIHNRLQQLRKTRGIAAAELARRVGVSRQTIYAIEDGSFVPNTTIALHLAQALDVRVEDIFVLDSQSAPETLDTELLTANPQAMQEGQLVRLCRVNERLIAIPVPSVPAYLPAADGIIEVKSNAKVSVRPAIDIPEDGKRLLVAGCDPALSLLAELLESSGIEMIGVPCSSRRALEWLKQNRVHAAGSHLLDAATGDYNIPIVKRLFPKDDIRVVTFAVWEQGLVLGRGNPKQIRDIADLANGPVTLVNREKGSGSRDLLDKGLLKAGIAAKRIAGYENLTYGHLAAAYAVANGTADCCIATRSAARCFGLDFIPLAVERFDLSFSKASLELPSTKALLDLLNRSSLKRKLEAIAGYDTAHTGEVLM
jgi:molybdopterin molybdotransferase/putative molybdopterin biosynthesis protein